MRTSVRDLTAQLHALGVDRGGVLLVHMSYRAVRPVDGGPEGVIDALLAAVGETGTVVMPSWTDNDDAVFDPLVSPANSDLGVTASLFWRRPGARRGNHPFAFAAFGPRAAEITADPLPLPPHRFESAVGRVLELGGQILLLGVGHDSDTTIHLAEAMSSVSWGVPKHITVLQDGQPARIDYLENDHCCQRFTLADEWLRAKGLQREGPVGNARARLVRSRDLVEVVGERLRADPLVFLHPLGSGCAECDDARASIGRTSHVRHRSIPTFGLTHLALGVSDVDRAFGFYEAVFAMVATHRSEDFLQAETPGMRDILVFEKRSGVTGASADIAHFGFRAKSPEDLKDAAAVVAAAGGTIVEQGEFCPGEPYLFARDRDGYLFEIWYELPLPVEDRPDTRILQAEPPERDS